MSTLRLPATMESLNTFRSFVIGKVEEETGLESIVPRVDVVLEEVLVNVIHYAYKDEGWIEVECDTSNPEKFRIIVRDWGAAFNPLDRAEPDVTMDIIEREVGGLGIFLVRNMTNGMSYERKAESNVLTLVFDEEPEVEPGWEGHIDAEPIEPNPVAGERE